ncbi:MAG: Protein TolB [Anaerolineae bacterium]|nr:Protein TolB [Anaerolineae bacterium]
MLKKILGVSLCAALFFATALAALAQNGAGPDNALLPYGQSVTLAPNAAQWFRFQVGGKKADATAFLDAASADGLRLAVYTPQQVDAWRDGGALHALGMGSPQRQHTLGWFGSFNQAGTYYVVAYNDTGAPMDVRVTVQGDSVTTLPAPTATPNIDPLMTPTPRGQGIAGKLAFTDATGGDIYIANGDGTNLQRITFGMDPQWNHAGTQLTFARQGPVPGIYVINADGSDERLLYQTNEPRAPIWSADDSEIIFGYQGATKGGGERCFGNRCFTLPETVEWRLGAVNVADGAYHDVRTSESAITPSVAPDGTIVYSDGNIGLMKTTSTGAPQPEPFIGDLRITSPTYNPLRLMSPVVSPDGSQIIYMVKQQPTWQIAQAAMDGGNQRLLTRDNPLALAHPSAVAPQWSPDGKQILFLSDRNGRWEFFTMNADGSNVQQVLKNITDQIEIRYDYQAGRMMSWAK